MERLYGERGGPAGGAEQLTRLRQRGRALQRFLRAPWRHTRRAAAAARTRGRTCAGSASRAPHRGARRRASIVQSSSASTCARLGPARLAGAGASSSANSHGLPSAPRASITAAAPVRGEGLAHAVGVVQAAGEDHRRRQRRDQARGELVVGAAFVVDGRRAGVKADRRDAGLVDEPMRELEAAVLARRAAPSAASR